MLELIINANSLIFNNEIKEYDNTEVYILLYNYNNVYFGELTYNTIVNLPLNKYCIIIFGLTNKLIELSNVLNKRLSITINEDTARQSIYINNINSELNIDYVDGDKIYVRYTLPISKYFYKRVRTINELTPTINSNLLNELNDNIDTIKTTELSTNIISQIDNLIDSNSIDSNSSKSSIIKSNTKYSIYNSRSLLTNINNITTRLHKYKHSSNQSNSILNNKSSNQSSNHSISTNKPTDSISTNKPTDSISTNKPTDLYKIDKYINNLDTFTKKHIDNNKSVIEQVDTFISTYNTNVSSLYTEQLENIHQSIITDDINEIVLENKRISAIQNIKDETTNHINKINEFKQKLHYQLNKQKQDDKNTKSAIKHFDIIQHTNKKLKGLKQSIINKNTNLLLKLNEEIKNVRESVRHRKEEFKYNINVKEIDIRDKIRNGLTTNLYKNTKSNSSVFIW